VQHTKPKTIEIEDDAMKYALSALAGATALAISLIAGPALAEDEGIVVYNAQHENLTKAWAEGFTKETGIKVTVRNGGDSDFSNQIVAEGSSSPADVFLTENSPAMVLVETAGLFAPVNAETLAQVPQEYQPASGKWVGVAARSTVFAYNKTKLTADQLPKSLLDLAGPLRPPAPISRRSSAPCCSSRVRLPRPTG
jgi:iron(III) transport system substrate-binding protein